MLGTGIIKGMAQTAKNFAESFRDPKYLTTVQYPEQRIPTKENNRNFPFLVHDGDNPIEGLRCVACHICEKECPPQCIYIEKDKTKKPDHVGKLQFQPLVFDIDISVCMSCQICVEVCPFDAIKMDTDFELSQTDRFAGLLVDKHQLAKSNDYYRKIHPTEAKAIDANRAAEVKKAKAKAAAKAKADAEKAKGAEVAATAQPEPTNSNPSA
ncbi:MAG: NADH-quinone oxidoreductase subunit I [Verrucomicrobia subdivision 3 bacterium]|nr:NADH-quinone oxidoreductase subunit I [Limisphaerales bacterium]MCS1414439.1 NADH-quinone oxidoreductase subunit I [Limisphaerales bacterium]